MDKIENAKAELLKALRADGIDRFGVSRVRDAIENLIDAKIEEAARHVDG